MVGNAGHDEERSTSESSETDSDSDSDDLECDGACGRGNANSSDISLSNITGDNQIFAGISGKGNKQKFSNIAVLSSSDVHLGNKAVYNGPVTINNYPGASNVEYEPGSPRGNTFRDISNPQPLSAGKGTTRHGRDLHHRVPSESQNETPNESSPTGGTIISLKTKTSGSGLLRTWLREVTSSRKCVLVTAASCMSFAVLLGILLVLVVNHSDKSRESATAITHVIAPHPQENDSGNLIIVKRNEWHATPSKTWKIRNLIHPVDCIVISHTASDICLTFDECAHRARVIQELHQKIRAWPDFGYNFLVGGDGYIYEGRGWDKEPAHPFEKIKNHVSINFIGTFDDYIAPDRQILAAKQLIEEGVRLNKVAPNYDLVGLRQLASTVSPGSELFKQIQTWPHWSKESQCMNTIEE